MIRLLILALLFVTPFGCKKAFDTTVGSDETPKIIPSGVGNLSGGGGGGAVQDVRKAAARTVNDHNLDQMYKMIFDAMTSDPNGKVPNAEQIKEEIRQAGPIAAMVKDGIVILTNTQNKDGVWAYTKWPQRGGKHYVITGAGRGEMTPDDLTKALQAQGSTVTLEK